MRCKESGKAAVALANMSQIAVGFAPSQFAFPLQRRAGFAYMTHIDKQPLSASRQRDPWTGP